MSGLSVPVSTAHQSVIGTPPQAARTTWAERLSREIPLLYGRGEMTVAEIAEAERVAVETVVKYVRRPARERRRHDVHALRARGVVPAAIADALGMSDRLVARYLNEGS